MLKENLLILYKLYSIHIKNPKIFMNTIYLAIVDAVTKGENQTPLHYAAKNNAVDCVRILLNMGADIGARDYKSRTPLFVAAETGMLKC